jgi:histone deacetylase complex regulatory component SIN3
MYDRTQILSSEEEKYKTTRRESAAIALRLKPQNEYEIPEYYSAFLEMLKSLLDGNMDATTYEDKLRDMYGIHAYIAFTLDRVRRQTARKENRKQKTKSNSFSGGVKRRSSIAILRNRAQCPRMLRALST